MSVPVNQAKDGTHSVDLGNGVKFWVDSNGHFILQVANADGTITVTDMSVSGRDTGTTSATIGAGKCVAVKSDGTMILADSTDATKLAIGVSEAGAGSGASVSFVRSGIAYGVLSAATPGAVYYLDTAGGLTVTKPVTSGHAIQVVGIAFSATDLMVQPSYQGTVP